MAEQVFLNDKLIDADKATVPVSDSGLLYGAGLFETMRAHNGVVFSIADHLERLLDGAKKLGMQLTFEKNFLADAIYKTIDANELTDARLRVTVTGGDIRKLENRKNTLLIAATQFTPYPKEYYEKGVLVVLSRFRQNPFDPTHGNKTTSYFPRMLALNEAHFLKATEALWFTTEGKLAEGCVSNVFLVRDGKLFTPTLETPVLAGIARKTMIEIALTEKIEVIEQDLSLDDLLAAEEVFLTNVVMQAMPVCGIEKHVVGEGKVGAMTKMLKEKFTEQLEEKCRERK